jgi:hypothetical protein
MPKRSFIQKAKPHDWKQADAVWALITLLTLPSVALSLTAIGWSSTTSFIFACLATLAVLVIQALVCGRIWIFNDRFSHIFDHEETSFRILVVSGGVLLVLETFLILQFMQNPAMDGFFLDIIAQKQCLEPRTSVAKTFCPMFRPTNKVAIDRSRFALVRSLEDAAEKHLIPGSISGSCLAMLWQNPDQTQPSPTVRFLAHCQSWQADSCASAKTESALITADLSRNDQGFYSPTSWQTDTTGEQYVRTISNQDFMRYLDKELQNRCTARMRQTLSPSSSQ